MDPDIKENIGQSGTWGRAVFMVLFGLIYSVAEVVLLIVVVLQFGFVLLSAEKNERLLVFGEELSRFVYQVFLFLTYNREDKPFPFDEWPKSEQPMSEPGDVDKS
ncbi:MAG: DUF4389 domain-containing protein [Gammaproteobacteria bacterium]|nr:DUF4389 domain-containing protein [Gammaproteobacteria bacterium]MDH5801919.1 DUF4389 domain-containing protein [Gammaproteobacteria bacterium]